MFDLKVRLYNRVENTMHYIDSLYYFKENSIHYFDDFKYQNEIPMLFSGKLDNGGAEIWQGDKLTNNYIYGEVVYSKDHAAFMIKYLHLVDSNLITLKEALSRGFYRIGNVYCEEH